MCSSLSLSLPSNKPFLFHRSFHSYKKQLLNTKPISIFSLSLSNSHNKNSILDLSSETSLDKDDYNGWAIAEHGPTPFKKNRLPAFVVTGIGASVVLFLGVLAYFSISSRGFKFRLKSLDGYHLPFLVDKKDIESEKDSVGEDGEVPVDDMDEVADLCMTGTSINSVEEKKERVIVPLPADHAQQEAVLALKKLKIIEENAKADELCSRRQYARWLVLANSQLERSRKHRLISSAALSGSRIAAFDDVGVEDPEFEHIQSYLGRVKENLPISNTQNTAAAVTTLAESGVIRSKLSEGKSGLSSDDIEDKTEYNFSPERFISREDLVGWKAKIEYEVMPGMTEQMSMKNIGFLDAKAISSHVIKELYMDLLADEKSILKGVFGQSKRLQPSKPCTKGQAAVALTKGRMTESIEAEILRLEAEIVTRQSEMKEVINELLERGEIKHLWEKKMEEEKRHGFEVEMDYQAAIACLEQEKKLQEEDSSDMVKQRAAMDCQKQLVSSLRTEITDMSERLALEKAECINERHGMENVVQDLQVNYEKLLDKKSVLEAEIEALRKLRSWVEDEAKKSQARAKVLEEAARRWKWDV